MVAVDNAEVGVDDRHARFRVYCVKAEELNVLAVSLIFVCTTQTSEETSTATHVYISKQRFRQSVRVVYGYNIPYSDATPLCLVQASHPVEHNTWSALKQTYSNYCRNGQSLSVFASEPSLIPRSPLYLCSQC